MIKAATETLVAKSQEVFGKIYQQEAEAGEQSDPNMGGDGHTQPEEDVVDADYEVVDEDEK